MYWLWDIYTTLDIVHCNVIFLWILWLTILLKWFGQSYVLSIN